MLDVLENYMSSMRRMFQSPFGRKLNGHPVQHSTSSGTDMQCNNMMFSSTATQCFGFGKVCADRSYQALTLPTSIPLIRDTDLTQNDDEYVLSPSCDYVTSMTNCSWRGCRVTVKRLTANQKDYLDLLLIEQDYCSQLVHPQLLQLMAVSLSNDLHRTSLVFEPVIGTLHNLLHIPCVEFPVLQDKWRLSVVLQICEGLLYLHSRGLVMRILSSHCVVLTKPSVIKLTGLSFTVPCYESTHIQPHMKMALPAGLYRWAAPEVVAQRPCSWRADVYSLCAVIQELYTGNEPWSRVDLQQIKQVMSAGQALTPDTNIPHPYCDVILEGLQPQPQDRNCSIQTLCHILQQDIEKFSLEERLSCLLHASTTHAGFQFQTIMQHTTAGKPGENVVSDTVRPTSTAASLPAHTANTVVEARLEKISKPKQARKSMFHPDCPSIDILPLLGECDSSSEEEQGSDMAEPLTDVEASRMTIDQQISTIAVNLQVSRELLLQGNRNLDSVENYLQQNCIVDNQVDLCASSSIPMSTIGLSEIITGPPSPQYGLLLHKGYQWAEHLEVQLMNGNWELLGDEELALWMDLYPAEQSQNESSCKEFLAGSKVADSVSDGADHDKDELTQYKTALCDSSMMFGNPQQALSFQENADVTPELSRPVDTEQQLFNVQSEHEDFSDDSEETDTDASVHGAPVCSAASTNMAALDMALLAELSSITCSPCLPEEKHYRPVPPCNSTPRGTDIQQFRMVHIAESHLPESSACSPLSSVDLHTQSFTTAVDEARDNTSSCHMDSASVQQNLASFQKAGLHTETPFPNSCSMVAAKCKGEERKKEGTGGFTKKHTEEKQELMDGSGENKPGTHLTEKVDERTDEQMEKMDQGQHRAVQYTEGGDDVPQGEKEVKPVEDDANEGKCCWCDPQRVDSADATDPEKKEKLDLLPESQQSSFLQDTLRAHSTLDDLLQGFVMVGIGKSHRTREHVTKLRQLFEGDTSDDDGRPAGGGAN
ncbi:uncharacterized protein tex14 isoform X2 [Sphaeramia orbicularis]|uniref:uncharacterized protein tex14 isoform X2 n=1 Tax=Sphaeramia orbicularis TaxID=375764 RepID=UPI00117EEF22|nr:inactive serine/threonine-protein kinase TEX14 isoform X2 [Sphaeramia orbicularis]